MIINTVHGALLKEHAATDKKRSANNIMTLQVAQLIELNAALSEIQGSRYNY